MTIGTGGWRCCCGGCWDWRDYFTEIPERIDMPCRIDWIGPWWTELSPASNPTTWHIGTIKLNGVDYCVLAEEGNPGATIMQAQRIRRGKDNPETSKTYTRWGSASVNHYDDGTVGSSWSILMSIYRPCGSSYNYLEYRKTRVSSGQMNYALFSYIDGTETELASCTLDAEAPTSPELVHMTACVSQGWFWGDVAVVVARAVDTASGGDCGCKDTGYRMGLRHGNSTDTYWEGWEATELNDDLIEDCPPCGLCLCTPTDPTERAIIAPPRLIATFTGYLEADGTDCTMLTGMTAILDGGPCRTGQAWSGCVTDPNICFHPWYDELAQQWHVFSMALSCGTDRDPNVDPEPNEGAAGWRLHLDNLSQAYDRWCSEDMYWNAGGVDVFSTAESTCDPFVLVFDFVETGVAPATLWCPDDCLACQNYPPDVPPPPGVPKTYTMHWKIVVTEAPANTPLALCVPPWVEE